MWEELAHNHDHWQTVVPLVLKLWVMQSESLTFIIKDKVPL